MTSQNVKCGGKLRVRIAIENSSLEADYVTPNELVAWSEVS